jgi:hypothetical protein
MAAPLGFKTFATGDVLTAADTNGYLMQGVWTFANAAARTAAVTSPVEGNMSYLSDTNSVEYYSGSAWVAVGGATGFVGVVATNNGTAQSYVSGGDNILNLPAETVDTDGYHSTSVNTSRITIPTGKGGKYAVNATARIGVAIPNYNILSFYKNGSRLPSDGLENGQVSRTENGSNASVLNGSIVVILAAGDYLEIGLQNSAASASYAVYAQFSAVYLGA